VAGPGWRARLDEAPPSPERDLHLGYHALARGKVRKARKYWRAVVAASPSAQAYRALGLTDDDPAARAAFLAQAVALDDNLSLLIEYATAALAVGQAADVVARIETLDPDGPRRGRFQMLLATAYIALGRLDEAGAILGSHLVVPDIREGAATFTEVWHAYQVARGTTEPLPAEYDFRMRPDA
jgi:tetratricopeptide (TPR) repeat protein